MAQDEILICFSDELKVRRTAIHWAKDGVVIDTKWHFQEGTELEFAVECGEERRKCCGIVVACKTHPERPELYETFLFFLERPCPDMRNLCSKRSRERSKDRPLG